MRAIGRPVMTHLMVEGPTLRVSAHPASKVTQPSTFTILPSHLPAPPAVRVACTSFRWRSTTTGRVLDTVGLGQFAIIAPYPLRSYRFPPSWTFRGLSTGTLTMCLRQAIHSPAGNSTH